MTCKFLTQEDYDYLGLKQFPFREARLGDQNTVTFPGWVLQPGKYVTSTASGRSAVECTDVMIIVPEKYNDAGLDSFYTTDRLQLARNSADPQNTAFPQQIGSVLYQFWSRHLTTYKWRAGIDGLETYLPLIRQALETA